MWRKGGGAASFWDWPRIALLPLQRLLLAWESTHVTSPQGGGDINRH